MILNLKLILSTFLMIFLAELGDKTQVSAFALATGRKAFLSVFIGAAGALVVSTVIAVSLGTVVGRFISEKLLKFIAAAIFLGFGALTLYEAIRL